MNGKRKNIGSENGRLSSGGWQIIYSGFILILLCFFVLLTSYSTMEEGKVIRFVQSFGNAVSILSGGIKFSRGKVVLNPSSEIIDKEKGMSRILEELRAITGGLGLKDDVNFSFSEKGLVMRLSDSVLFETGIAKISPGAIPLLEKVGSIISKTSKQIRIEGHTDNIPIHTKRYPSNWELSTARAVNVLRYFLEKEHISTASLSAVGYGEFQPLYTNDSPKHRAMNRRVEIVFERHNKT